MKKVMFLTIIATVIFFTGCKNQSQFGSDYINCNVEKFSTASGKIAALTVGKTLETQKVLESKNLLTKSRSVALESGLANVNISDSEYELIKEDLQTIKDELNNGIEGLIPDYSPCVDSGLISLDEEKKNIIISDDQIVPLNSIEGIMTVEVMNLVASGKTIEEAVQLIQTDIENLIPEEDRARGIYINPENSGYGWGNRWLDNTLKYHFEDGDNALSENYRREFVAATQDWHDKVKAANNDVELIKFKEVNPNGWEIFCDCIMQYQYLRVRKNNDMNADGRSNVGAHSWDCHLEINEKNINGYYESLLTDPKTGEVFDFGERKFTRVPRHELGHALGIFHEHQRSDRNSYLYITDTNNNYEIIPDKKMYVAAKAVKVWFMTIYLPYVWYGDYGVKVGSFDMDSIMLYFGEMIKPDVKKELGYVYGWTKLNYEISKTDVETVISIYGK